MSRYSCAWEVREGERICRLRDDALEVEADIAVTFGMNVIRLTDRGEPVVFAPPALQALRDKPFRYGIPFLSLPGRTKGGEFRHRGSVYRLPVHAGGHHVHGELGALPWQLVEQRIDPLLGASLRARFDYKTHQRLFSYFPHELVYELVYRLHDGVLSLEGKVWNEGDRYAPLAFGFHPYFHRSDDYSALKLQLPALVSEWPLNGEGEICGPPGPTKAARQLGEGTALSELEGTCYSLRLEAEPDEKTKRYTCRLIDEAEGRRIDLRLSREFSELVLFVPPWGNAISLEPLTCVPDAFNLSMAELDMDDMELAPGATRTFGWSIQTWKAGD